MDCLYNSCNHFSSCVTTDRKFPSLEYLIILFKQKQYHTLQVLLFSLCVCVFFWTPVFHFRCDCLISGPGLTNTKKKTIHNFLLLIICEVLIILGKWMNEWKSNLRWSNSIRLHNSAALFLLAAVVPLSVNKTASIPVLRHTQVSLH